MNKQFSMVNGQKTNAKIEWCDYTNNPIGGCFHDCQWRMPDGALANCYAEDVAERVAQTAYPQGFRHHYWRPELLSAPLKVKAPARIFWGSMTDLFGRWVPDDQIQAVLDACAKAHWHTHILLTKNAPRLLKFEFPPNCWVGASVPPTHMLGKELSRQQQIRMLYRTFDVLGKVKARATWLSIEPLAWDIADHLAYAPIGWAVIGAATNGAKVYQPEPEWVRSAIEALDDNSVKIFFKGNLRGNPAAEPWREEFPAPMTLTQAALW